MIIKKETNKEVYCANNSCGYLIGNGNKCEYVRLVLAPGGVIELHSLPFPVTFYILKGTPDALIKDSEIKTGEGDLLEVEANLPRGWKNNGPEAAELLVIKHI